MSVVAVMQHMPSESQTQNQRVTRAGQAIGFLPTTKTVALSAICSSDSSLTPTVLLWHRLPDLVLSAHSANDLGPMYAC